MDEAESSWGAGPPLDSGPDSAIEPMDPWDLAVENEKELQKQKHKIGLVLRGAYVVECKIGFGTYGSIYAAEQLKDGSRAAIKFEVSLDKHTGNLASSHLYGESQIYKALAGGEGIPRVAWCGQEYGYNIMIMDLLGPNLEQLHQFCDYNFSLSTVLALGDVMVRRIKWVHEAGYLHRDIKAANFLIGRRPADFQSVYLIDFGLAKSYRQPKEGGGWEHMEYREGRSMVGTARYASVNSHRGCELSRRDDLEALGYILIGFHLGHLPWQEIKAKNKKLRYKRMLQLKLDLMRPERLASLPTELSSYLRYVQRLAFAEDPDYNYLSNLFSSSFSSFPAAANPFSTPTTPSSSSPPRLHWATLLSDPRRRATWDIMFKWAPASQGHT